MATPALRLYDQIKTIVFLHPRQLEAAQLKRDRKLAAGLKNVRVYDPPFDNGNGKLVGKVYDDEGRGQVRIYAGTFLAKELQTRSAAKARVLLKKGALSERLPSLHQP